MLPSDYKIRIDIQNENERSVVVEASAGTGKTTLLTDRVKTLVTSGIPLEKLAIVTFTEAAANELRTRIREILSAEQLKTISQTWITTIHGFASKILREYFHLCNSAPEFSMETTHFSKEEMAIQWDIFLSDADHFALQESAYALNKYGSSALLKIAREIEKYNWLTDISSLGDTQLTYNEMLGYWKKELKRISCLCTSKTDLLFKNLILTLNSFDSESLVKINRRGGSASNWGGKNDLKDIKEQLNDFNENGLVSINSLKEILPVLPAFKHLVFPFVNKMRNLWFQNPNRLSFDDLLYKAWKAVSVSSILRKELNKRFAHIFIDEFQDTSLVQVKLFTDLLEKSGLRTKITVVGDPKQSIFGWRSADIETYQATLKKLNRLNALSKTISVNFRSTRSIIDFINPFSQALFAQSAPEEMPFSCSYSSILPSPTSKIGQPVTVHLVPDIKPAQEMARVEAEYITTLIKTPSTTAILFRTGTRLDALTQALDKKNIPYKVEASRDFHKRKEVEDTATLLKTVLNPSDTFSLIQTYRSIFFGITDIDITKRQKGVITNKIKAADILIEQLRVAASYLSPFTFIQTLFANTCLLTSVKNSGYQVTRRLANLRYILETSEEVESYNLLLEILLGKAPISAEEPSAPPENTLGAVTLTTIHRAKGLAWNHVILTNPGKISNNKISPVLVNDRLLQCGIKIGNGFSAHFSQLKKREKARSNAEYRRLLYVAVTRPKLQLDILLPTNCSNNSPAGILKEALKEASGFFAEKQLPNQTDLSSLKANLYKNILNNATDKFLNIFPYPVSVTENNKIEMQLGTEVHSILEFIDFSAPKKWICNKNNSLHETLEFPKQAISLALKFFSIYDLTNTKLLGREFPLIINRKQYYIDLLLKRGNVIEIIDYKTDSDHSKKRIDFYREKQLLYKKAIAETMGEPVRLFLVFLKTNKIIEIIN